MNRFATKRYLIIIVILLFSVGSKLHAQQEHPSIAEKRSELHLPTYFTDNMVLPRNRSFLLHGEGNPSDKIQVTFSDEKNGKCLCKMKTRASEYGTWSVKVPALAENVTYTLSVKASSGKKSGQEIVIHGILAGEIWLASGQSNMAFQMQQSSTATEDIANSRHPNIRLLNIRPRWDTNATVWSKEARDSVNNLLYYHNAVWQECTPELVKPFSAVAYHFARTLQDSLKCPIGIICNAVGGSGEEAWIDRMTLEANFPEILNDWTENEFIQDWVRGRAKLNMAWQQEGMEHNPQQRHPYEPCYLYDSSIRLLQHMPITGVIWYQGESNAHDMDTHARLFPLLLKSWRETWHNDTLPFIYTQLSSLNRPTWPEFRDLQRQQLYLTTSTEHSSPRIDSTLGMAVTSDVGDSLDVHPRNKRPVGNRLARWALRNVYQHNCVCSGPLYHATTYEDGRIIVHFDYADGLQTSDGKPLRTFEISDDGINWHPVTAAILGNKVVIEHKDGVTIRFVRYGWQPFTRANLINADGLPASTFKGRI